MKTKLAYLKFGGPRLRARGSILVVALLVFFSIVVFARPVARIPESVLPFPDRAVQLSGMPATFQTAVLPKWEIGQRIPLASENEETKG
jgi:hypothetical protein